MHQFTLLKSSQSMELIQRNQETIFCRQREQFPSIYDNGTHYVSTHRLTLEILKKLNDVDYVLEIMGDYTGGSASIGPQHDRGDWKRIRSKLNK